MAHKFDAKKAEILDSADRRKFLNPDSILGKAGLSGDTIFADLGCGSGYFSIPASLIVKRCMLSMCSRRCWINFSKK